MNRIKAGNVGARIATDGAAGGRRGLGRGIGDGVTGTGAAALEGVEQTEPVADLVGAGVAEVVVGGSTAGGAAEQDAAAVLVEGRAARGDSGGEVAVTQVAADFLLEIQVESRVTALAKGSLHR